jgi:hypothetical protein
MSYDLFFKPRHGRIDPNRLVEYFSSRRSYEVNLPQVIYVNQDTGVYFIFDLQHAEEGELESYPVALNINLFRPSYFILEAEPEVTAFVRSFDMAVFDPQAHGMDGEKYDPELLITGWNDSNKFGYSAILRDPQSMQDVVSLPTAALVKVWSWNYRLQELQNQLGDSVFVPRVIFLLLAGQPVTAAVWPDGIPIAVPEVDFFLVPRKNLAPRRFLRKTEDRTLVAFRDAFPILARHRSPAGQDVLVLDYNTPPSDIAEFIELLPLDKREIKGLPADQVLDRELVEAALA